MTAKIKGTLRELGDGLLVALATAAMTGMGIVIGYGIYIGFQRVCG